jgi:hypothetical protein
MTTILTAAPLFYRSGKPFEGTPQLNDHGRPWTWGVYPCRRCGGPGGSEKWRHTGWTCYDCGGSGKGHPKVEKLYTADQLIKLNAAQAKRHEKRVAEVKAKADALEAERAARRQSWLDAEQALIARAERHISALVDGEHPREQSALSTLNDLLTRGRQLAGWTDEQRALVVRICERLEAHEARQRTSQHVGSIGERLSLALRVINVYEGRFHLGWQERPFYISTLVDGTGNVFIVKSGSFHAGERDSWLTVIGTVHSHGEYQGIKQTRLARVKPYPATAADIAASKEAK